MCEWLVSLVIVSVAENKYETQIRSVWKTFRKILKLKNFRVQHLTACTAKIFKIQNLILNPCEMNTLGPSIKYKLNNLHSHKLVSQMQTDTDWNTGEKWRRLKVKW